MKPILYIKASSEKDVRLSKFLKFFKTKNIQVCFWGWNRYNEKMNSSDTNAKYIFNGKIINLPISYCVFMVILFFKLLFFKKKKYKNIICINFETALPVYIVSKIRHYKFIYEIYDEFSKSYPFPAWLKHWIEKIDLKIIKRADYVIHVDKNRIIGPEKSKSIIIENTPFDYWKGRKRDYTNIKHKFAIVGFFSDVRGMEQIYKFAKSNSSIQFFLAGRFTSESMKNKFVQLSNVEFHDFMPQEQLFSIMKDCCSIFSLYNPSLEINRLAASNKVYDAMMLGIPVLTNPEVVNSSFIEKNDIGYIINYKYDSSWDVLSQADYIKTCILKGRKGRELYLSTYKFEKLVEERLLPLL